MNENMIQLAEAKTKTMKITQENKKKMERKINFQVLSYIEKSQEGQMESVCAVHYYIPYRSQPVSLPYITYDT